MGVLALVLLPIIGIGAYWTMLTLLAASRRHTREGVRFRIAIVGIVPYVLLLCISLLLMVLNFDPLQCETVICGDNPATCTLTLKLVCDGALNAAALLPALAVGILGAMFAVKKLTPKAPR